MVDLSKHSNNTTVIDSRNENGEKICQKCGLLLEVEGKCFVITVIKDQRESNSSRNSLTSPR